MTNEPMTNEPMTNDQLTHHQDLRKNCQGAIGLLSVIVMGGVMTMLAVAVVVMTLSSRQSAFVLNQSDLVFIPMEGCSEEELIQLSRDNAYLGSAHTIDGVSCTSSISGDPDKTIALSGSKNNVTHDLSVEVQLSPSFGIINWTD